MNTNTGGAKLAPESKYQLHGLSHKSTEAQTLRILRINAHSLDNHLPMLSDLANKSVRSKTPIVARRKQPGEAHTRTITNAHETKYAYRTGDGELGQLYGRRPGANDHQKFKSYGDMT